MTIFDPVEPFSEVHGILAAFDPIMLEEMDTVKLMNRVDTKYIFPYSRLPLILSRLQDDFRILEIGSIRLSRYETLYFDTAGHKLYLDHHNGKLNRYKVRCRKYIDSDKIFFEVKHKSNKERTAKVRISRNHFIEEIDGKAKKLVESKTPVNPESLLPALRVSFSRMTFVSKAMTERVTIDTGLQFRNGTAEKDFPWMVIAELKQDRNARSPFRSLMQHHHIVPTPVSKFCLGMVSLYPQIKKNNFKQKIHTINKLNHEIIQNSSVLYPSPVPGVAGQGVPGSNNNDGTGTGG